MFIKTQSLISQTTEEIKYKHGCWDLNISLIVELQKINRLVVNH